MPTVFVVLLLNIFLMLSSFTTMAQVYTYTDENGITVLTNKKPDMTRYHVKNHGCFGTCRTGVNWSITPLKPKMYATEVNAAAKVFGVDKALIRAIMHAESWFEPAALSRAGAQGLMQLMPATQKRFGVSDPHDPQQNINGGVEYLAWLMKEFNQDKQRVIAAYNAGENAVKRHDGVPPFNETREYLRRVNILYKRYNNHF
ncbi:lytic transglycosylase domain-containing protein [Glaciecola petra]|uniref:Lytic transglycosylase domain-containing protein n=1 Tax=Glaciecola petra TaxID=3075602 RepID=A0ABU2ZQX1_9ALTE|nr:lytic transglycosylase domain-containing protein [Aestuariibacter sp. P117]MDT0595036.1 lytic transglycosylase domain-containing protein [Aestuariibacter sp. P117]